MHVIQHVRDSHVKLEQPHVVFYMFFFVRDLAMFCCHFPTRLLSFQVSAERWYSVQYAWFEPKDPVRFYSLLLFSTIVRK